MKYVTHHPNNSNNIRIRHKIKLNLKYELGTFYFIIFTLNMTINAYSLKFLPFNSFQLSEHLILAVNNNS